MRLHGNAELTLNNGRTLAKRIVEEDSTPPKAATAAEVTARTARKWADRYRAEGEAVLFDRPSAPRQVWNRTEAPNPSDCGAAAPALHRAEVAEVLDLATSTVSAALKRIGLAKLSSLDTSFATSPIPNLLTLSAVRGGIRRGLHASTGIGS